MRAYAVQVAVGGDSAQFVQICGFGSAPHSRHHRGQIRRVSVSLTPAPQDLLSHDTGNRLAHGRRTPPTTGSADHRTEPIQHLRNAGKSPLPAEPQAWRPSRRLAGVRSSRLARLTRRGQRYDWYLRSDRPRKRFGPSWWPASGLLIRDSVIPIAPKTNGRKWGHIWGHLQSRVSFKHFYSIP
jgi:hypothetical protein